uniref:Splicing factor U2af small subunit B-like n=1 Tax=Nelumbo nucifera TaxID=4432 RepID=A0A822ZSC4_NELNU|nr:TPA_asm: hypothetical protein HUJ06_016398 [Nelumbo nucifera]
MAEHLASIFGTEKDRVNCPFYFKIGACRHGDRCSRLHNRPTTSPTLLLSNMYQRPDMITPGVDAQGQPIDPKKIQEHFEDFYEDIFEELNKFGEIENLNICDNLADHMVGNVYVQFKEEEQAAAALQALQGRFYSGRPIIVDFSPVTDFREATCRQFEENSCNRGGYCNFMHVKQIGRELRRKLFGRYRRSRGRSRSRSSSPRYRKDYRGEYRDRGDYRSNGYRGGDRHGRYDSDGGRRYDSDGETLETSPLHPNIQSIPPSFHFPLPSQVRFLLLPSRNINISSLLSTSHCLGFCFLKLGFLFPFLHPWRNTWLRSSAPRRTG